jgi:hypothetical protein
LPGIIYCLLYQCVPIAIKKKYEQFLFDLFQELQ